MFDKKLFKITLMLQGKTIKNVAEYIGIDTATMYRKTNGVTEFTRLEIQQICTYLNLESPMEIFFTEKLT